MPTTRPVRKANQAGSELTLLTKAQWRKVILGTVLAVVAIFGIYIGALLLADAIWP